PARNVMGGNPPSWSGRRYIQDTADAWLTFTCHGRGENSADIRDVGVRSTCQGCRAYAPTSPNAFGGERGEGVEVPSRGGGVEAPCLLDPVAPDAFGTHGWFGTRALGFEEWRALLVIKEAGGLPHSRQEVRTRSPTVAAGSLHWVANGIVKQNVLPRPRVVSTQMRPPWASMMPFAMVRPRPAPCLSVGRPCQ